jgi:ADP-dependent phosphofructokinase/glucokinase
MPFILFPLAENNQVDFLLIKKKKKKNTHTNIRKIYTFTRKEKP